MQGGSPCLQDPTVEDIEPLEVAWRDIKPAVHRIVCGNSPMHLLGTGVAARWGENISVAPSALLLIDIKNMEEDTIIALALLAYFAWVAYLNHKKRWELR